MLIATCFLFNNLIFNYLFYIFSCFNKYNSLVSVYRKMNIQIIEDETEN